jgi:hypothetical protein
MRIISLTAAGLLHCHGPGCPGSSQLPTSGSMSSALPFRQKHVTRSSTNVTSDLSGVSPSSSPTQSSTDIMELLRHHRCRVLKRVPKASRPPAAEKLAQVLRQIVADRECVENWLLCNYYLLLSDEVALQEDPLGPLLFCASSLNQSL